MIPLLGMNPPETLMPFSAIAGGAISGSGNVSVTLPTWVRNVGRYSLLVTAVGSWGGSAERGGVSVLNASGAGIIALTEGYAISGSFLSATQAYHSGSGLVVSNASASWAGGSVGTHTYYFLFEGIVGAASVRIQSVNGNPGNPTYFNSWNVIGIGRGRRDPANWAALQAGMTTSDGYLRIICS